MESTRVLAIIFVGDTMSSECQDHPHSQLRTPDSGILGSDCEGTLVAAQERIRELESQLLIASDQVSDWVLCDILFILY